MKKNLLLVAIVGMMCIALTIGTLLAVLLVNTNKNVNDSLVAQAQTANHAFANMFEGLLDDAISRAEMIAGSQSIVDAVKNQDYEGLLTALKNYSTGLDLITLCDAEGVVLARTHNDKTGDSVISQAAIATALSTGKGITAIEPGTVIGLSTRGSAAIKDADGTIIGALTCGHDLSQERYIDAVKEQNKCEATFFAGDTRMSTTLIKESGVRDIGSQAREDVAKTVLEEKKEFTGLIALHGITYQVCYTPVLSGGNAVGMLFTGVNADKSLAQGRMMVFIIIVAAVMLVMSVVITLLVIRYTMNKAFWYESMLDSIPFPISVTDMKMHWTFINKPVEQALNLQRSKVLGKPCSNWGAAICKTRDCGVECLRCDKPVTYFEQGGCDFKVDTSYLYDKRGNRSGHIEVVQDITKVKAAQKAQEDLVMQINEVADSFVQGSRQIADGSQALAQGSTQQAASVEELSASISVVAQKTKDNADMAFKAADLGTSIKTAAEKGTEQMNGMIQAVREIGEASQNISKVIKVVDDIAFQTNILALNAAVEAARAGQHGKGFAVVAEEVRNLAAKSSEAAKDTGVLITNSMDKARLGAQIADDTAQSLQGIVEGIDKSSAILQDIASSTEEQSSAIEQINKGIEQVATVVHQNSATAEQSAAASSSMSEQADLLESLVSAFNAKNSEDSTLQITDGK